MPKGNKSAEEVVLGPDDDAAYWRARHDAVANERDWLAMWCQISGNRWLDLERKHRTTNVCRLDGCDRFTDEFSAVGVCMDHMDQISEDYFRKCAATRKEAAKEPEVREMGESVVYYIRMGDNIKIGKSSNIKNRMATFYAQPDQLLAIEPGGLIREAQRHQEFRHLRVGRTELFRAEAELLDHVASARATFGDPARFLE